MDFHVVVADTSFLRNLCSDKDKKDRKESSRDKDRDRDSSRTKDKDSSRDKDKDKDKDRKSDKDQDAANQHDTNANGQAPTTIELENGDADDGSRAKYARVAQFCTNPTPTQQVLAVVILKSLMNKTCSRGGL
jgi:hypothetical protein